MGSHEVEAQMIPINLLKLEQTFYLLIVVCPQDRDPLANDWFNRYLHPIRTS